MTDAELQAVWDKDKKQVKLVEKDAKRKVSMTASFTKVHLAEDAIKSGTIVENVSGVIDTSFFLAKEDMDQCIQHLESDRTVDWEWLVEALRRSQYQVQMASMEDALMEMAGFGMVDTTLQDSPCGDLTPASADG